MTCIGRVHFPLISVVVRMGDTDRKLGRTRTEVGRCPFSPPPTSTVAVTTGPVQWLARSHGSRWAWKLSFLFSLQTWGMVGLPKPEQTFTSFL